MARFFTPPKSTGPASNKKAEPVKDRKHDKQDKPEMASDTAGSAHKRSNGAGG